MGDTFEAERYLRVLGESLLADQFPELTGLIAAAGALVAAGVIEADAAQDICDSYDAALAIRSGAPLSPIAVQRARLRASAVKVPRVAEERIIKCERVIERAGWTLWLKQVLLSEEETSLVCGLQAGIDAGHVVSDQKGRAHSELVEIPVSDDRGTMSVARFNRRPDSAQIAPRELRTALAIDTAWIEIDGERVELRETRPEVDVTVAPVDRDDPALRHLWHQVAIQNQYGAQIDLGPAVSALRACGAIDEADAADLFAVHAMLSAVLQRPIPAPHGVPVSSRPDQPLLGRCSQMLTRSGQDDGPAGEILLSTVLPPIDGISVAIRTVTSYRTGFDITVQCKPSLGLLTGYSWQAGEQLAWWSADDVGNHYLGLKRCWVSHDHSGREDDSHATITFWPPLDPTARRLELIPTAERTQAVLGVTLPWGVTDHQ